MIIPVLWMLVAVSVADQAVVRNLMGEPDYRQVRLHWEVDGEALPKNGFTVRFCELQTWGAQRCRNQSVKQTVAEQNSVDKDEDFKVFSADIKGLRMATTYSFEVKPVKEEKGERTDRAEGDDMNQNMIVIPTKGFSAKATQCLPEASEISVSTGPYFGGRIAVEAADGERCAVDGEPGSLKDTYTLRINHAECGSQVNETTVATFVLVQENLPILTHSTRRFLVLCSYQPETLTVRAGISLPTNTNSSRHHGKVQAQISPYEGEDNFVTRRSRTGRVLQKPEALVKERTPADEEPGSDYKSNIVPIFVITMLAIAAVIGIVAIALKIAGKKLTDELDDVSIASDLSTTSYSTVSEIEVTNEKQSESSGNKM
ncbi:unnamed protein product [Acanthoscelides obtectus]|uniref:ZP domain-containing protein n=1 Tax=Acanthoscelides obtectus TaxID=200917 RepID=A0A9P0PH39_ACAOB|nr:unnamed protein product [Acanthoscelides obtectus]CAK1653139.1 hypothetical protein AOBTE_LOCUS18084 [Acanthoscelides obtectus]